MKKIINNLIDFYKKAEKLKTITRHSWLSNSTRQESVAEHTWMLCLLAMIISEKLDSKINLFKVLKMLIIHDLAEAVTGDIPAHEISKRQKNKYKNEERVFKKLTPLLSQKNANEIIRLWREFEKKKTVEAKFANSLDKIEVIMQHTLSNISSWDQGDFDITPYYKNQYFNFDTFMRDLKDEVDGQLMKKIIKAKKESRVDVEYLKKYKQGQKK